MRYDNKTIANRSVLLDGDQFIGCRFNGCVVQYAGGVIPLLSECKFDNRCVWQFIGAADLTIKFLRIIYNDSGDSNIADQIIKVIKHPIGSKPDTLPGTPMSGFSGRN